MIWRKTLVALAGATAMIALSGAVSPASSE
jgi:hypothetical protein